MQFKVECREAIVCCSIPEICGHAVSPKLAPGKGRGRKLEAVQVHAYAKHAPRLTVEVDGTSGSTRTGTANRVELHDDPACPEFADEICHCGNAEAAAACNVMAAASSMVAYVAKDLGEVSLA